MVNDINNINESQSGTPRSSNNNTADNQASPQRAEDNRTDAYVDKSNDTVQFSAQAQELGRIQHYLQTLPEIDEARVNEIRERIDNDTYTVNANLVAAHILADEPLFR